MLKSASSVNVLLEKYLWAYVVKQKQTLFCYKVIGLFNTVQLPYVLLFSAQIINMFW